MSEQDRFRRVDELFRAALRLDPEARAAYLDECCGDDAPLRAELESLLDVDESPTGGLDRPPLGTPLRPSQLGLPQKPAAAGDVPTRIGPYEILRPIGEGGMGVVYEARQHRPVRRTVALKIIKLGMDTKEVIARFESERQALAMMSHPNIARVLDAGATETGRPYFVMELVRGVPITKYCDRNNLSTPDRLELFMSVCRATQHAHQKGIIHRDIKPGNVLVTDAEGKATPKVIDFGVAKAVDHRLTERTLLTEIGQLVGTPQYMSPEQAGLSELDVDTRTDIYSLGVLLYELLTGVTPFDVHSLRRAGVGEIQRIIQEEEPAKPSTRVSSLREGTEARRHEGTEGRDRSSIDVIAKARRTDPQTLSRALRGDLDWIVMRALEKDRTRRYETAGALAADIDRHMRDEPVEAGPPSAAYRFGKFARRNRGGLTAAAAVATAVLLGLVLAVAGLLQARQQRDIAQSARREETFQRERAERALEDVTRERNRALEAERLAETRRASAERARDEAETVTDFLADMLAAADPWQMGRDVTVRAVLDQTADAIEGQFDQSPLVEASIRQVIGKTYRGLGLLELPEAHYLRAIELRSAELGPEHPETLDARNSLAVLCWAQERDAEAREMHAEILEVRLRDLGDEHPDTLDSMLNLAAQHTALAEYETAERLYAMTLATRRRVLGPDHADTLEVMNNLGAVRFEQGRHEEAIDLYREILEIRRRTLGEAHLDTVAARSNLGAQYGALLRLDEAEPLLTEALRQQREALGDDHPSTLTTMNNLGLVHANASRFEEAEPMLRECLERRVGVLGDEHRDALQSMGNLGFLLYRQRRYAEAAEVTERVLAVRRRVLGDDHPDTLVSMKNLATQYARLGRRDEAETLYLEVLETRRRLAGDDDPGTLEARGDLAALYRDGPRVGEAVVPYQELIERQRRVLGAEDARTLESLGSLGFACFRAGRHDEAASIYAGLLEVHRRTLGPRHPTTLGTTFNLAAQHFARGRYDEAAPLYAEVLAGRAETLGEDHPDTLNTLQTLAVVQARSGRLDEAEPLLTRYLEAARGRTDLRPEAVLGARDALAQIHFGAGRVDRAEPLLREVIAGQEQLLPPYHPARATSLVMLGTIEMEAGDLEGAESRFRDALRIRRTALPDGHWQAAAAAAALGATLARQGRYAEAEPLLLEGWEGLSTSPEAPERRARETRDRLVELYEAWGRPDEARQWEAGEAVAD